MHKPRSLFALTGTCLLASLTPSDGVAYPTTPVSYGQNPIWSAGGYMDGGDTAIIVDAIPTGQTLVVTDVFLTLGDDDGGWNCRSRWRTTIQSKSGPGSVTDLAMFHLRQLQGSDPNSESIINATFSSGLPIAGGQTLQIHANLRGTQNCDGNERLYYTLSGYYAES